MSREDAERYIVQKNRELGRDPFFLQEDERLEALNLLAAGYNQILTKGTRPQTALKELGRFLVDTVKSHIDNNVSQYSPQSYNEKYRKFKIRKRGSERPFLKLDNDFYNSLRYVVRKKK